jgi:hypothetical protein
VPQPDSDLQLEAVSLENGFMSELASDQGSLVPAWMTTRVSVALIRFVLSARRRLPKFFPEPSQLSR